MKVMIRVPNWVGDAVMAVPALRELRRIFIKAEITLIARPWVAGLFDGEGLADYMVFVEDAKGLSQSVKRFFDVRGQLRRKEFDYAVLLQNAFGAALMARAAGAKNIAGYPADGRRALLHTVIPFEHDYKTRHQVSYYLNIAAKLEEKLAGETHINLENREPSLYATKESQRKAQQLLAESGIEIGETYSTIRGKEKSGDAHTHNFSPGLVTLDYRLPTRPILAINPGATNSRAKQWLAERFAETADMLAERDGFQTVIIGTQGDLEVAREVASRMRTRAAVLAGRTDIAELKGVLASSSLVLSNDTGAAHVSAALRIPTVVIFGPTEDFATRPFSQRAAVVRHNVDCSPCMLRDCPIDHRCMTRVEANEVYRAARKLLAQVSE